jgi:hypothetical protein
MGHIYSGADASCAIRLGGRGAFAGADPTASDSDTGAYTVTADRCANAGSTDRCAGAHAAASRGNATAEAAASTSKAATETTAAATAARTGAAAAAAITATPAAAAEAECVGRDIHCEDESQCTGCIGQMFKSHNGLPDR